MQEVFVVAVHTTRFGKYLDRSIKQLASETVRGVLKDAPMELESIQSVFFSNSVWGFSEFQHSIRGQVALRPIGIDAIPITNVENACASGSTAFHCAYKDVACGLYDVSLAVGVEKLYQTNKYAVFAAFLAGTDVGAIHSEIDRLNDMTDDEFQIVSPDLASSSGKKNKRKKKSLYHTLNDVRNMAATGIILGESIGYDTLRKIVTVARGGKKRLGARGVSGGDHSPFMDIYAYAARKHMAKYGSTQRQLASIASKNHWHSSFNPNAQYTFEVSVEHALNDRLVAFPLTRSMCAPIGDGAASAILMNEKKVRQLGLSKRAVRVRSSILGSGKERAEDEEDIGQRLSQQAYENAGIGPREIDVVELHDATAYGELHQSEALGFFRKGEGGIAAERGETRLGGKKPINPSGGLISRGHPIGASGLAQIHELVTQLRSEAKNRQVEGARLALAENGGGAIGVEEAAMCVHIFQAPNK